MQFNAYNYNHDYSKAPAVVDLSKFQPFESSGLFTGDVHSIFIADSQYGQQLNITMINQQTGKKVNFYIGSTSSFASQLIFLLTGGYCAPEKKITSKNGEEFYLLDIAGRVSVVLALTGRSKKDLPTFRCCGFFNAQGYSLEEIRFMQQNKQQVEQNHYKQAVMLAKQIEQEAREKGALPNNAYAPQNQQTAPAPYGTANSFANANNNFAQAGEGDEDIPF